MRRAFSIAFALGLWATRALAVECTDDPATCGRREFDAGISAYKEGDYQNAADHFTAAYGFRKHPIVLFNLALAEAKLGHVVEALAHFDQVLADGETPKDLLATVRAEKQKAGLLAGRLSVDAGVGAEVYIDDQRVEGEPAESVVNPGEHKVRVAIKGQVALERTVRVAAGERFRVALDRATDTQHKTPKPKPKPKPLPPPERGPSPLFFYVGAGVTAVLGGVTIWSALDTKKAYDAYQRDFPNLNQAAVDQRVDDGHKKELRTNVLIGATAVAAAGTAAIGLFVVDWGKREQGPRVGLGIVPGGVTAAGSF